EPLGHGRFRYQEGARDLGRGEPAEEPERQRNLNARRERGMAAGEDQAELIVAHRALLRRLAAGVQQRGLGMPVRARCLAPEAVDRAVARGGDDPSRRAGRQSGRRPPFHRCREGVLDGLLGNIDVAEDPDQDGHRATVLLAEYMFNLGSCEARRAWYQSSASSWNGRTSIGSGIARASLWLHSSAASRSGALMTARPPMCSLPSAYGPSVVSTSPALSRTTVAVLAGCKAPLKTHAPAAFISPITALASRLIFSMSKVGGGGPSGWLIASRYCFILCSSLTLPRAPRRPSSARLSLRPAGRSRSPRRWSSSWCRRAGDWRADRR